MDDESANKVLKGNGSDAAIPKSRDIGRIIVSGYDGLPLDDVESALRRHFSSCGEITDLYIPIIATVPVRFGYIYFVGQGAVDKALQLCGSDVGGWTVSVKADPFPEYCVASLMVKGYDISLSDIEIQSALSKHFSSCGEVKVNICRHESFGSLAAVYIYGKDAQEKAMQLSVFDMGGRKLVAKLLNEPEKSTVHRRPSCLRWRGGRAPHFGQGTY